MKRLETNRTILRDWKMEDAADMYAYASSSRVGPMAGWKPHDSIGESRKILAMFLQQQETWAVELKETGRVIGSVGLHKSAKAGIPYDRELGYVLAEPYWGKGIIPEAADAAIRFAFDELRIETLLVSHFPFNLQSKRVIEKAGFRYLKRAVGSWKRYDGVELDEEVYTMSRDDYRRLYG